MSSRPSAFCIVFVVAMVCWAMPAAASFPGANGPIVHNSCGFESGADCGLFLVNTDVYGSHQITHNPTAFSDPANGAEVRGRDRRPVWSADRRYIAYASERGTSFDDLQTDLYVLDFSTGQQTQITNTPTVDELAPAWSPDGTRIAFVHAPRGPAADLGDLYVMDADGTNLSALTTGQAASAPDWSPDGSKIAFAVQQPDSAHHFEINTITPAGTGQVALTSSTSGQLRTSIDPSWSPDGARILFARADRPGSAAGSHSTCT